MKFNKHQVIQLPIEFLRLSKATLALRIQSFVVLVAFVTTKGIKGLSRLRRDSPCAQRYVIA